MSKADLKLPSATAEVDVVYRAPRMICTSRHAIKAFAEKYAKRVNRRNIAVSALTVFLSALPVSTTNQNFSDFLWMSGEDMPGVYRAITGVSAIVCIVFGIWAVVDIRKANTDYMIRELVSDGDSSEAASNVSLDTTPASSRMFKSFSSQESQPN